jgi:hypothetical protein
MLSSRIVVSCSLAVVGLWTPDVRAAFVVTNAEQWDGQATLTGPSKVWGQTFPVPTGYSILEGVSFWIQSSSPDPNPQTPFEASFRASVYGWDGQKATGPVLGSAIIDDPAYQFPFDPAKVDFDFSHIELVEGKSYVAIVEQLLPSPGQLYLGFVSSSDSLPGTHGGPYAGNINFIRLRPWTLVPGDLVMEFRYAVPEPASLTLFAAGGIVLLGIARFRHGRRFRQSESQCFVGGR